ncbi:hypothetical protein DT070_19645 [Polaromonas sp. SP1]|uniref:hypothetical protein n=1 Tax=Polaromonas sp. SP1 TaxID=2268087 RepID=UPI000F088134|nr:hypothetical protein [Polaromonas sp. SP1]AYQ30035.1 hypothetical protein DT070_19645 [Polaromonas sp. SP1]
MTYFLTTLSTAASMVAIAAALNWTIDPAGLYRPTTFGQQYAKALIQSEHGLIQPDSMDEREYKSELAKFAANYDCVVIGSSHVMQIGSERKHRSFPSCKSILNLGVSGAAIEDHITLTWLALSSGKPRKLIFGIDPWTFAYEKDERWKVRFADSYLAAQSAIGDSPQEAASSNRWSSLVSAEYTSRSIGLLSKGTLKPKIELAQNVDEDVGGKFPIILQDGSNVYSSEYITSTMAAKVPIGGTPYKTTGVVNDFRAVTAFIALLKWVKSQGVQPVLLMTPYHQNVWLVEASPNVKAMIPTEKIVREIGLDLGVAVIGSYRPDVVNCRSGEFYDFMHATASCLAKMTATPAN